MAVKVALLVLALLIAWFVLFRPKRSVSRPGFKPPPAKALEACPRCGVYRVPGGTCDCDQ